ncbi:MAG: glycerol-3-phosphate cytidylyltransferase [Bacteroidetes bacterium RIFCSPLOWO2_12_FULL_37_12]|nr:MAG: glycerol-3-phosphate cytidylyltransferase [Bacteroidetes bacterium RIFCSPLOWO2_12_FULL_37_12]
MKKITSLSQLLHQRKLWLREGKTLVFTNGCFDLLHLGHVKYLEKAKSLGDILVIGLNSDKSVKKLKGKTRPILDEKCRAGLLASFFFVDFVILFHDLTPLKLIEELKPDVLVKGGDYKIKDIAGAESVKNNGGKVIVIPFIKGYSTTKIINKIKNT